MNDLFLDTGYVIALISKKDERRKRAQELSREVKQTRPRIVTTQAVLVEVANALAAPQVRGTAAAYINMLRKEPFVDIVPTSQGLLQRGFSLYTTRQDKDWGWTDCMSFVVMRDQGLRDVLAHDRDFKQAGFNALLRDA
jgi:predicted nucleic acid-binding protein